MSKTVCEVIDDFRRFPCNDRERRIVEHLKGQDLETYCILRNTGNTVTEALSNIELESKEDCLKLAMTGNALWVERHPARRRYFHKWRIADECDDLGCLWIHWQVVDAYELADALLG